MFRVLAVLTSPFVALATPTVISDHRIQDSSLTPALGRGYSQTTNDVLSTCLTFKEKTEPTYNFAYDFHEVGINGNLSSQSQAAITGSLSYSFIQTSIKRSMLESKAANTTSRFTVMTMSMERYYSSIEDTTAELTPHALSIIERGNLVGFFAACGSGYIRSIRRSAEMTAIFEFTSSSANEVRELAASMTRRLRDIRTGSNVSRSSLTNSETTITIRAFGLGLNIDGASDLVATSIEDYQDAVEYAFKSMQHDDVGIVKGVEVVPWTNNLQFNDAVSFESTEAVDFDEAGVQVIGTGGQLNPRTGEYDVTLDADGNPTTTIDESKNKILSGIEVKGITTINAEFITYLEAIYADKVYYTTLAWQCSKVLHAYMHNDKLKKKILVDKSMSTFESPQSSSDCGSTKHFTVEQVGAWFTTKQLQANMVQAGNFITEYYGPCASAITKFSRNGRMTKYWWELPSCWETMCAPGMVAQVTRHKTNNTRASECVPMAAPAPAIPAAPVGTLELLVDSFCMPQFDEVATEVCAARPPPSACMCQADGCALITTYWDGVRDGVEPTCEAYCQELGGSGACE